jgi:hypothetical protein
MSTSPQEGDCLPAPLTTASAQRGSSSGRAPCGRWLGQARGSVFLAGAREAAEAEDLEDGDVDIDDAQAADGPAEVRVAPVEALVRGEAGE